MCGCAIGFWLANAGGKTIKRLLINEKRIIYKAAFALPVIGIVMQLISHQAGIYPIPFFVGIVSVTGATALALILFLMVEKKERSWHVVKEFLRGFFCLGLSVFFILHLCVTRMIFV